MKKLFAAVLLCAWAALAPAAAQTGNVAIGPIYSVSLLGVNSPLGQGLGVTGKIPGLAPIFGTNFYLSPKDDSYFFGLTADWLLYKEPLYAPFNLNFYVGPGFYTSIKLGQGGRGDAGLRIPVGINWVPLRFFEIFGEITPAFGIAFQDPIAPTWLFQSAAGARVWF
jgi:hypothetical protein